MAQVDDLMALEGDTPLPTRALPLGGTSHAATPEGSQERMMGNAALMLGSGGGHFGSATRERLASLVDRHLPEVPLDRDDVVHIVEYGALNSRCARCG